MQIPKLQSIWYEKYRPRTLEDMILPAHLKDRLRQALDTQNLPHLGLFSRTPGTGKSSLARVIQAELQAESLWINASLDKGIDILRTRIQQFAAQQALGPGFKLVVMDEFDHFTRDGQAAFRGFIDQFPSVRFIFTGNYKENIIEPLLDRLEVYDFNNFKPQDIAKPLYQRLEYILNQEHVQFNTQDIATVIKQYYPRIRTIIGILGASVEQGRLNLRLEDTSNTVDNLILYINQHDIKAAQKLIYQNSITSAPILSALSTQIESINFKNPGALLNAYVKLAQYQHQGCQVPDQQLNLLACIADLMLLV